MDLKERFLGAILGCAVGDALGAPYEGKPRRYLKELANLADEYEKMSGYPLGQYTDDTQMTLKLCESIISRSKIEGKDVADRFSLLWRSNSIIGEGASCRDAMMNIIARNADWDEAGTEEGRAGNGAAMRVSPVGLFDSDDLSALKDDAITQAMITHRDKRAKAGAVAVAAAIYYCIHNKDIEPHAFLDFIIELTSEISDEFSEALRELKGIIDLSEDEAFINIASRGVKDDNPSSGITPFVIQTVLASFYHFLKSPDDWKKSVEGALGFGGDTDTTASITSAISGCYNGYHAIPRNLIEDLKDTEYIHGIALKLYDTFEIKID